MKNDIDDDESGSVLSGGTLLEDDEWCQWDKENGAGACSDRDDDVLSPICAVENHRSTEINAEKGFIRFL